MPVSSIFSLRYWLGVNQVSRRQPKQWPHDALSIFADKIPSGSRVETFVETGTFRGETTIHEAGYFRHVFTIELSKKLFEANISRFAAYDNIHASLGSSADRLPEIIAQIDGDCLFYLDAHWSGDATVDWASAAWKGFRIDTAHLGKGIRPTPEEQCPLIEELRTINKHFVGACVILIDDFQLFGKKGVSFRGEDWSHISVERLIACLDEERVLDRRPLKLAGQNPQYGILLDRVASG